MAGRVDAERVSQDVRCVRSIFGALRPDASRFEGEDVATELPPEIFGQDAPTCVARAHKKDVVQAQDLLIAANLSRKRARPSTCQPENTTTDPDSPTTNVLS